MKKDAGRWRKIKHIKKKKEDINDEADTGR